MDDLRSPRLASRQSTQWGRERFFFELAHLDQSRNLELWQQLRETLATNEDLRHPEVSKYLQDEERAVAGYWWYDPANWRQPSEADCD